MISSFSAKNALSDVFHWRGTVTERRNALADSDESTDIEKEVLLGNDLKIVDEHTSFCKNCCTCKTSRGKFKKSNKPNNILLGTRSELTGTHKSASYRDQLEMKILNDELYVQGLNEKQGNAKEKVITVSDILKTLSMYAHCLEMRHKIGLRLQQLINKIIPSKENNSNEEARWENISKTLMDIFHICTENSNLPDAYYENLEEHKDKKKDFTKASENFCRILQQREYVTNGQLRKLELQYEEIKLNYSESTASIGSQLSDLIDTRAVVAERCLQNMAPVLQYSIEEEKAIWCFFKELTFTNINSVHQPDRVNSVKSLPDKLNIRSASEEKPKCTCPPRNYFPKAGFRFSST